MDTAAGDLGRALDTELKALNLVSPGPAVCGEIIQRVFARTAEATNTRQLTGLETEEISKRSI